MTIDQSSKRTHAWLLERLAQGELGEADAAALRARLAAEGRSLDDELAALRRSNEEILASRPKEMMAAVIRRRAESPAAPALAHRGRFNALVAPLALVGALGIAVVIARGKPTPDHGGAQHGVLPPVVGEIIIAKGTPHPPALLVYRQRPVHREGDTGFEKLSDGARASRGDLLQLAYEAHAGDAELYGVLVSIDGAQRVTQHVPDEGAHGAPRLQPSGEIRVPAAYQLDDAPGFERFVLITAPQPFDVRVALDAARALAAQGGRATSAPLPLAPSFHQTSILIRKNDKGTP
jgi:hypothetical protein